MRKAMPEYLLKEKSKIITEKVIAHPAYQQAELMLCYIDAKGEVMTSNLIEHAWKSGKKVAVPRVHGDIMKFYFIESFEQLENGCFGIREPKCECRELTLVPDNSVVIMPGVADTWCEGTKYIFRAASMTCFFICFMASVWAFGFLILMDCVNAKK